MSLIVKTEAVVLKTIKYGESSKIVTFFTRSHGKIAGIVKGARSLKKRYGSPIDILSYVTLVFYHKEGREVQTVSQCDTIHPFRHVPEDIEKISVGMTAAELIHRLTPQYEQNTALFTLLVDTLRVLDDATKSPLNLLYYFEYHFARILGFEMSAHSCGSCGKVYRTKSSGLKKIVFDLERGSIVCSACRDKCRYPIVLSSEAVDFLSLLSGTDTKSVVTIECSKKLKLEIDKFLWGYLSFHIPEMETLKSRGVFNKITEG
jgi:DNA repair protein RecO (recombination protein O)